MKTSDKKVFKNAVRVFRTYAVRFIVDGVFSFFFIIILKEFQMCLGCRDGNKPWIFNGSAGQKYVITV